MTALKKRRARGRAFFRLINNSGGAFLPRGCYSSAFKCVFVDFYGFAEVVNIFVPLF